MLCKCFILLVLVLPIISLISLGNSQSFTSPETPDKQHYCFCFFKCVLHLFYFPLLRQDVAPPLYLFTF